MRSGTFVKQLEGYTAFIPAPLPPKPSLRMDAQLNRLLSDADRALGRLMAIRVDGDWEGWVNYQTFIATGRGLRHSRR